MFIETSSPQTSGMVARMLTPTYPAPSNGHCLEFYYNMYGQNIDTLSVILQQQVNLWKKIRETFLMSYWSEQIY